MYAPKSKNVTKPTKSKISLSKTKGNAKSPATVQSTQRNYGKLNKINTMFESQALGCSGNSSVNINLSLCIKFKSQPSGT